MAEHEHDWLFAYAALAANATYTAHYDCRGCATTRDVRGLSHTEVTVLVRREQRPPAPVAWTADELRRLRFWQQQVAARNLGADDTAPLEPHLDARAYFDMQVYAAS